MKRRKNAQKAAHLPFLFLLYFLEMLSSIAKGIGMLTLPFNADIVYYFVLFNRESCEGSFLFEKAGPLYANQEYPSLSFARRVVCHG